MSEIFQQVQALCERTRAAAPSIACADDALRNRALEAMANRLLSDSEKILDANRKDLDAAAENGVPRVMLDRLSLSAERLLAIADAMRALCALPDPTAKSESFSRPSGIEITCTRVPLGVVAIIFEARPNVTADAAALCL